MHCGQEQTRFDEEIENIALDGRFISSVLPRDQ